MSDLKDFSDGLQRLSEQRERERVHFNAKLGEPAHFIPDIDDARFGTGFWKAEGGVVSYRKYANGYDHYSRMEYDNELIDILVKVRG